MEVSVTDIARARGVSARRVLQLIREGEIVARQVGGRWLIDERELNRRPRLGRPMSTRMAWAFVSLLSGEDPGGLDPAESARLKARIAKLRDATEPAALLSSWLRARGDLQKLRIPDLAIPELAGDARLLLSGVSDPRSGLSATHQVEGYARPEDVVGLERDHLLIPSIEPNVYLHIADVALGPDVPLGLVIADLADHNGPREDAQVRRLLGAWPNPEQAD